MEREALIDIILNDLNEMHTLVSTFKGKPNINGAFINLAKTKLNNIGEELTLLESFMEEPVQSRDDSESSLTSLTTTSTSINDANQIAESSKKYATGEATAEEQDIILKPNIEPKEIKPEENKKVEEAKTKVREVLPESKQEEQKKELEEKPVESRTAVLGEKMITETKSVNEKNAVKNDNKHIGQIGKPVDDVRKAIGLNDRFYYQRELFEGNADLFNQTLDQLNQMDSYSSALQFIQSNYNWEDDNEVAQSFLKNIQRRFI